MQNARLARPGPSCYPLWLLVLPGPGRMDRRSSTDIFLFEGFRFHHGDRELFRLDAAGNSSAVSIGSRALDLLGLLLERAGKLVSKSEIIDAVWGGSTVEEANLTVQISALRRILDLQSESITTNHAH